MPEFALLTKLRLETTVDTPSRFFAVRKGPDPAKNAASKATTQLFWATPGLQKRVILRAKGEKAIFVQQKLRFLLAALFAGSGRFRTICLKQLTVGPTIIT